MTSKRSWPVPGEGSRAPSFSRQRYASCRAGSALLGHALHQPARGTRNRCAGFVSSCRIYSDACAARFRAHALRLAEKERVRKSVCHSRLHHLRRCADLAGEFGEPIRPDPWLPGLLREEEARRWKHLSRQPARRKSRRRIPLHSRQHRFCRLRLCPNGRRPISWWCRWKRAARRMVCPRTSPG